MTHRLNLTQAIVVPWPIPDIDADAPVAAGFAEAELGRGERFPEPAQAPADLSVSVPAPTLAPAAATPAPPAIIDPAATAAAHDAARERALHDGREHGYAEGFIAGQRAAERQCADQLARLDAIVQRLGEPMRSLERPIEEAVIALALEVARWVIGNEITMSRDHLVRLVRDAVARVPIDVGTPSIVLNPADADLLRALAPDLESSGIPLVIDDTIEPGGCLVIANGADGIAAKDRRWHPRARQAICEVDLTLTSRWRNAMFAMFEGEDA
jgi:flagellar assembly protein FliH